MRCVIDRARRWLSLTHPHAMWLLVAAIAPACQSTPPAPPTEIVIGATLPLTGLDAAAAVPLVRGYERAVAEANAAGGIRIGTATIPVRLDVRDDASDAAQLERVTRDLIAAGAHAILATPRDVRAVAQSDVTETAGALLIGNPLDHPGLPGKRMQWMLLVGTPARDPTTRAHDVAAAVIAAFAKAGTTDARRVRDILRGRTQDTAPPTKP